MAISLSKGGNISLSKEAPNMDAMTVGLGWDTRATDGAAFDLDAAAFMLTDSGKVADDSGFIFYNQLKSADGSVEHTGDNKTGEGDGDDEQIKVQLSKVPANITKIAVTVTMHDAETLGHNFGMISNAFIRVVDTNTNAEIARYDLSEDASTNTAMIFGEIYRHNNEWKFKAVGQGFDGGLKALANNFGISI